MLLLFRIMAVAGPAGFGGVMLVIGIILGGHWKSLPPADFLDSFGRYGGFIQRAIPLVVIPTLIGLAGMRSTGTMRQPAISGLPRRAASPLSSC
ncbi:MULTISPECIES: hypothetical protein [Rhizobium]|uniref:hypothetical protein n=1 Tax=Rhizobium TaxID=379 RepID=UPI001AECD607|nr:MULTISPECIES: hypothetical protein [Rhizobium]WET75480.1 hypothetical protein PYR68_08330 [Rhizobium croatiense]